MTCLLYKQVKNPIHVDGELFGGGIIIEDDESFFDRLNPAGMAGDGLIAAAGLMLIGNEDHDRNLRTLPGRQHPRQAAELLIQQILL